MMLRVPTTVKRGTRRNLQVFECCAPLGQQAVPKRTRLDLSCKELPRWTRIQVIFVLLVAKEMKLNFSDTFLLRRWLHPGGVSAAWLAQWKTTLNVVISFLFHFWVFFGLLFWWCLEHQRLERSASTLAWTWHIWFMFSSSLHRLPTLESCTPLFPKTPQLVSGLMKNARKKRTFDAWERKVLDGMNRSNGNEVKNVTP